MICQDPDCNLVLKAFEVSGGNDLCFAHRMKRINDQKKLKRKEKSKFMSDEDRKDYLTPDEIEEFYGPESLKKDDKHLGSW